MQRTLNLAAALVAAVALAAPGTASAQPLGQDLAFTTIAKGAYGSKTAPEQRVFQSKADYAAFFGGNPPASPAVDFSTEDVLAVAMGQKPTSGYATEITRVTRNTGTGGGVVHYTETKPTGMTLMVLTSPYHVVKVKKGLVAKYSFVNDSAPAAKWDELAVTTRNFQSYTATVRLTPDGKAMLVQSSPTALYVPLHGDATAAELKAVNDAFAQADVASLPATIKDDRVFIVAPTTVSLESHVGAKTFTLGASLDYYPGYETRVKPLVDALQAIGNRIKNGPQPAPSFDKVVLAYSGGFVIHSDTITLSKDGALTIDRFNVRTGTSKLYTGQATKAELDAVKTAFANADVPSLPKTITDPVMIMDLPSMTMTTTVGGQDYVSGVTKAGRYGTYEARVKPYVDAIGAIADRIVLETDGQPISGVVSVNAAGAIWVGGYAITNAGSLATVIAAQKGKAIALQAHVKRIGAVAMAQPIWVQGWTTANLNLRKAPYVPATIIKVLQKGSGVQITGTNASTKWLSVKAEGKSGWVSASYVRIAN